MKNITISMDDELAQAVRVEAARNGKSVSRFLADVLATAMEAEEKKNEERQRARRLERLRKVFDGPMWSVSEDGRMPTAEERNARR